MVTFNDAVNLRLKSFDPFRKPAWRWLYAGELLRRPATACRVSSDPWVNRAIDHRSADRTTNNTVRSATARFDRSIADAEQIFSGESDPKLRWFLEALLLTDVSLDEIAKRCQVLTGTVEAYAELFFDVRPYLGRTDWLLVYAVGCYPLNRFGGPQPGGMWKWSALLGGVLCLELCMATTGDMAWPQWLSQTLRSTDPKVIERFRQKVRLWNRMQFARTDEEVAETIVKRDALQTSAGRATQVADESPLSRQHKAFLKSLPKAKRDRAKQSKPGSRRQLRPVRAESVAKLIDNVAQALQSGHWDR